MRKIYIIICIILGLSLLSGCTGELPNIDENHESASEIAIDKSETTSSEQTESFKKDGSSNEESSKIEETTKEINRENTDESETETNQYGPTFAENSELGKKLRTLLEASYDNKIYIMASKYYFHPAVSWNYNFDITVEDGSIFIAKDREYYISSYKENLELTLPAFSGFENINELVDKLSSRECYILKTDDDRKHYGEELALYYFEGVFYVVRLFSNEVYCIHVFENPSLNNSN